MILNIKLTGSHLLVARGELAEVALQCMCTLLTSATHFNFRINLMGCIIGRLSKKSWDQVCCFFPLSVESLIE